VAELIVSSALNDRSHNTKFVSVRFGNVLGSNGSVVPLFQKQIADGGPVTVTHPEVRRYFMSVREAVQLVLQASTMGRGSEIFVLDMGEPIRIVDLATNMIRLAGLVPGEDIELSFVGLRPGEKLYEELVTAGENVLPTYHDKIKIFQGPPISRSFIESWLRELEESLEQRDGAALVSHLKEMVPEYRPETCFEPAEKVRSAKTVIM
jgi:FlaA1/EpsC-like NDP-sugar epimerase